MSAKLDKLQKLLKEAVARHDFDPDTLCGLALAKTCKGYKDMDRSDQSTLHLISCVLLHTWRAHHEEKEEEEDDEDEGDEEDEDTQIEAAPAETKAEPEADLEEGEVPEEEPHSKRRRR